MLSSNSSDSLSSSNDNIGSNVTVIGAGISGLAAALYLAQKGVAVTLIEGRDRLGGRMHSIPMPVKSLLKQNDNTNPQEIDLGASWVHGTIGNPIVKLVEDAGASLTICPNNGADQINVFPRKGIVMDPSISSQLTDQMWHCIFVDTPEYSRSNSPDSSLGVSAALFEGEEGALHKGLEEPYISVINGMTRSFQEWTGAKWDEVSLRYWGFDMEFKGDQAYVSPGYGFIVDYIASKLRQLGVNIVTRSKVIGVKYDKETENVQIEVEQQQEALPDTSTSTGTITKRYTSPYCICTLPLGVLKDKNHCPTFEPALPKRRRDSIDRLGFGVMTKLFIAYDRKWWPENVPQSYMFFPAVELGEVFDPEADPVLETVNFSCQIVPNSNSLCFYVDIEAKKVLYGLEGKGQDDESGAKYDQDKAIGNRIHKHISRRIRYQLNEEASEMKNVTSTDDKGDVVVPDPIAIYVTHWERDPFSLGSYTYIPRKNGRNGLHPSSLDIAELSRPIWNEHLGFAGEATVMNHYASVHGAYMSGERESSRVFNEIELLRQGKSGSH